MTEKRIQFNNIIQNQLPAYVREEFPLVAEFLRQYYISQEFQSSSTDLIQNIDQYLKLDNIKSNPEVTTLTEDVSFLDEAITVSDTKGFPDSYGLLLIDDEIITYTSKTLTSFIGCIRGFSGVSSYNTQNKPDELSFKSSESADHSKENSDGTPKQIINLSSLFLKEFFNKIKYQLTPGFEQREFYSSLDKYLFLKQSKDFYSTRGTDLSFQILFKVLYGEDVKIIKPQDYLIKPSDAHYEITNDLVVESVFGDPYDLERSTLQQDEYGNITKGYAPISRVEKIFTKSNKTYYKLSFDAGYNRDINVEGSRYGNFSVHPKTKLIGDISSGANTLDVDSTVGFPLQGDLSVIYTDGTEGIISYTSKSINQFFGCQNILKSISDASDIWLNTYAYGTSNKNPNEIIKVRITSVIKDIEIIDDTYYYNNDDTAIIKTLGVNPSDEVVSNNWIFNISPTIDVVFPITSISNNTYRLVTKIDHNLRIGDSIKLILSDGTILLSTVSSVISADTIEITSQGTLDVNKFYSIQRNLLKVNSQKYSYLSNQTTDVQNVYKIEDKTLVASSSLPSYGSQVLNAFDKSIVFSGTFSGDTFNITSSEDHGFYTGDSVYYTPSQGSLFDEGVYFIKRISPNSIKIAKSRANLYSSKFINITNSTIVVNSKLEDYDFHLRKLDSQKLLREINPPINDGKGYETTPGPLGILINGVEILNYKSKDKIYYDSIENIDIINPGSGYDVINPPSLVITDSVGTGATGYCSVNGSLQAIRIIDPGFDYLEIPKVNISGGNGSGAKASVSMKLIDHKVSFNSESRSASVNITNSTIGFSTYHKFRNAEKVVYKTNEQKGVGGISTNSLYYVSVQNLSTVKLHKTFDDALVGINTIALTSFGIGNHDLESFNKKSVISSINIDDPGLNYENKKRTLSASGVSTSLGYITIKDHDYQSGEIVKYSTSGSVIGGLTNNTSYYVTKVDVNNFKLSLVGIGTDKKDFYYQTKQYIKLTSTGSGIHTFNYPEITVEVVGNVGVSSAFKAIVQPIFRGELTSVYLENNGVGYGSSEIINFNRTPNVTLNSGSGAQLLPIINNGKIVEVLVINSGKDYNSAPTLSILTGGSGIGAVLTPVLENGQIKSVNIIESGAGYDSNNTFITVLPAGVGAELSPKLKSWTINLFAKYFNKITLDDGFIFYNPNSKYGLQYSHLYAPRKLRETVYAKEIGGKVLYGTPDLIKQNNIEVSSTKHSPIIGWAYDGNPIYGPYGFSSKSGGSISRMKSGYVSNPSTNRPPFPVGFFVEDYQYKNVNDDTVLDEYNGRFCITPDFPNGTYAYFATIDGTESSSFGNYRLPVFPYIIGNNFKSAPNKFNFNRFSNQDDINLNQTKWARNTIPYNLLKKDSFYSYLSLPNDLNQTIDIKYTSPGNVENVGIITGGSNYKVNDKLIFDQEGTFGFGFASKVSRIKGKPVNSISVANTTVYGAEIYPFDGNKNTLIVQSGSPHNFVNVDLVSIAGLNTTSSLINGSYTITVLPNTLAFSNPIGIASTAVTGIVTFISVSGNLSDLYIRENDIYKVGSEKIKILNVDRSSSRIRVLRSIGETVGTAHSYTDVLYELPRRFTIDAGDTTSYGYKANKEIYFDPKESIGIGTLSGVGIGITLFFSNPGAGITQIFIPSKTIYIPNHNLNTGDSLTYSTNNGTAITVSDDGVTSFSLANQSTVYVAKITNDLIGISTVKVGLGSTGTFVGIASTESNKSTLFFIGNGSGVYHSFKTNYERLSGQVSKNVVTVSTAQTHGLTNNDEVFISVSPGISTSIVVKYNDYNRKVLINSRSFVSADVDILTNSITILNHNFESGQKIVYTSSSPSGGLINNQIYYIVVFDKDTVKLSPSYYSSTSLNPEIVDITSTSDGVLSPVNPPIKVYKDSTVIFDLSDSSLSYLNGSTRYSAFELNFYLDSNYTQIFDKSDFSKTFEVTRSGNVGIDSDAKVSLKVTNDLPQKLYYKLDPVYINTLPTIKEEVNIDSSVFANNEIQIVFSEYNGKHKIISTSSTSFTYNVENLPESYFYNSNSKLEYDTTSLTAFGSVSKIDIVSKGQNYRNLPKFLSIDSTYGNGAILEASSKSIGKVKKTKFNNIGFDFSCDFTVRPNIILPQILKIEPLNSFESIGISSVGRGYVSSPKLVVLDGKTREVLSEVDLYYSLGDNYVTILNNTYRLNDIDPIIIPTQNSNGVGISSISYNSTTKDVTVTLSVGFSTTNSFPFEINDKVLIENISVGVNSTGKGFNSEDYNYKLFTIVGVNTNLGGNNGSVTYNLGDSLNSGEDPGTYNDVNSSGRIIPEKYFPVFKSTLKPNNFFKDEEVRYSNQLIPLGYVEGWDEKTKYLKVSSRETLKVGNTLEGFSSKTQGKISSSIRSTGFINVGSYSKFENGWVTETGILNNNLQRIEDNFYYQNFSYSLKSKVPYDTWENAVGSLNHTAGFKKFSDYQLETFSYSGISTEVVSTVDVTADLYGVASLNCVYDFDIVKENSLIIGTKTFSDEITFSSRILTDYDESIGNRVLTIDDVSGKFNSNPRSTRFSIAHRFLLSDARAQKYITFIRDKRYTSQRQIMLLTLLHDNSTGYLNQYGRVESSYDLGSFDFGVDGTEGLLLFYPVNYRINDYNITTLTYNVKDNFAGVGSANLGGIVDLRTNTTIIPSGSSTIVSIGTTYTSAKVLAEIAGNNGQYQFNELSLIHDGTNVGFLDYGQLTNHSTNAYSSSGLGTYYAYISGSDLKIDFTPNVGLAVSVSTIQVAIANTSVSGVGTFDIKYARFEARSTSISSTSSPTANIVAEYPNDYDGGYYIVQVSDTSNNRHQLSEVIVLDDENDTFITEFGNIETHSGLGTIGATKTANTTRLVFTPIPNIDVQVKVYFNSLTNFDDTNTLTQYNNNTVVSDYNIYYGTERDVKRSFELNHKGNPIFQKYFDGSSSSIVSIASSTIRIPNHFFVTGEKVSYSSGRPTATSVPIGIGSTDFGVGIGTTDKLPSSVYVIKIDENNIKLARSAEDALKVVPKSLNITSVGIGSSHVFTSLKQNAKSVVLIDNVIQSPIVSTSTTTTLSANFISIDNLLYSNSTTNLFIGDLIKIGDEIMRIESVGVGSTNSIRVERSWLGTNPKTHTSGSLITKVEGNYNIVNNTLNFVDAPYGNIPLGTSTNPPDERDWTGISTSSSFHGRVFMRSGAVDTLNEPYYKNYIFDDISSSFNGSQNTFTLTSDGSNINNVFEDNAIILINEIFQEPGLKNNYTLSETSGITSISFVGSATSLPTDINTSNLPTGGIIVSVGSTAGFGYQPLVSAGGTAIVSVAGTISSISIGNSGSGYRSSIQTPSGISTVTVRVGVATSSTGIPNIQFIGTAAVSNGNIVSIAITNPGVGYTSSNPPQVIIDAPLSYSDVPLIYSSTSSGIGTRATIDVVVGQGSSIIQFEIKNIGYGYKVGEILTLPIGGVTGIPTTTGYSSSKQFEISIESVEKDKFSGWTIGQLEVLDNIQNLFDGRRVIFPLKYNGLIKSVYAKKGSLISIQDTLLVFINDILQIPGEGYIFNGGSKIQFTEPPKLEDTCKIIFYKGSGNGIDVIFKDVIDTVKIGDDLQLTYDSSSGQSINLLEDERKVVDVVSIETVDTNPYFGPGNTSNTTLARPVNWCRQTEDLIINEQQVGKDRDLYEPQIHSSCYLIQSVGIGSSVIFVDNIRPFFNPLNEDNDILQKNVTFVSQDTKVSASATAIVSIAGTISSIIINDGGFGYKQTPFVTIQNPSGISTITSTAVASINSGIVTSISITGVVTGYLQENPPAVLIESPTFDIENNKVVSYSGDSGIIVGLGTTNIGTSNYIIFDLFVPINSYLRVPALSGTATTISSLSVGDFFIINNSNVTIGSSSEFTTLDLNNNIIGISTQFVDNVCQVFNSETVKTEVVGVGTTFVKRVFVKASGIGTINFTTSSITFDSSMYTFDNTGINTSQIGIITTSNYFGEYSWGKIVLRSRSKDIEFNSYYQNGSVGIVTSTIVKRTYPLKYTDYII